ncbi:hypothetical protein SADUNF_Sadunf02G0002000 [Salix dunnii]|uniref:BZIP domain-containing protein n=1 Tax=Salix dunnii TaxID=1413687 RepID=A0A835N5B9_9ROSI|nr:hypothetical protein SADUNF_Sadunf02G0002000 [Salix dunnii]
MEFFEEEVLGKIDRDNFSDELPDSYTNNVFDLVSHLTPDSQPIDDSSVPSWIGEVETLLMKDDEDDKVDQLGSCDAFLADILVDSPSNQQSGGELRKRDAAVRSRERKKMYVRDLEIKSRYLEGECRKLHRLLQCFIAENHALRLSLPRGSAFGATSTKQESAVEVDWSCDELHPLKLPSLLFSCRIPAVGFPALVPEHRVPVHPACNALGGSSSGNHGKESSRNRGLKRSRK